MENNQQVTLDNLTDAIDLIRSKLEPFMELPPVEWNKLNTADRCKMCVLLAYTLNSLFFGKDGFWW